MTRRERLENKLARRQEWAQKATFRSAAAFGAAGRIADGIPFGQPILVGHHSERRARRDQERIHNGMRKGVELGKLAAHHNGAARGLAIQLDRSVFSDDVNAIEALEARIKKTEANAARMAEINKAWRKNGVEGVRAVAGDKLAEAAERTMKQCPWLKTPFSTTGDRAAIRRDRQRIEDIKRRQARTAQAEAAPGGVLVEKVGDDYVRVTFPEKPAREVLDALRAAGFRWGQGSWVGQAAKLPAEVA